jgi:hypothetical protein
LLQLLVTALVAKDLMAVSLQQRAFLLKDYVFTAGQVVAIVGYEDSHGECCVWILRSGELRQALGSRHIQGIDGSHIMDALAA